MSRGQRLLNEVYDDWARKYINTTIQESIKDDIGYTAVTNGTSLIKDEVNELKKEIEDLKKRKLPKITIKVR